MQDRKTNNNTNLKIRKSVKMEKFNPKLAFHQGLINKPIAIDAKFKPQCMFNKPGADPST